MPRDWIRAFLNKPGHINLAIVMYPMVNLFEKLCGPLRDYRILHLTRDPRAVVRSLVQAEADKKAYGSAFKAHFRVSENPPPHAPISLVGIDKRIRRIAGLQTRYTRKLKKYKNVFTVTYESLTGDQEIAEIPEAIASKMLSYLGLDFAKLATDLQKTGTAHP